MLISRRRFVATSCPALALLSSRSFAAVETPTLSAQLQQLARDALQSHGASIPNKDIIGIADFSQPSNALRFHLLKTEDGSVSSYFVAHGSGSDPSHTGMLQKFSNAPGSNATSAGSYVTGTTYQGAHGRSLRLRGLDITNSNALSRYIVVHAADYVSPKWVSNYGKLGRSHGCFALEVAKLDEVIARLGSGRLLYAAKL